MGALAEHLLYVWKGGHDAADSSLADIVDTEACIKVTRMKGIPSSVRRSGSTFRNKLTM